MTNLVDIKAQLSNDPIDHYIMDHTFRPTPEQNELIEYTRSLPGETKNENFKIETNLSSSQKDLP